MKTCHKCGAPWESTMRQPGFKEFCAACNAYLHCCKNCKYHRRGSPNQCYIPNTEPVSNRAGANFCEEFAFKDSEADREETAQADAARRKLEDLLGPVETRNPAADLLQSDTPKPKSLDDLFRD